MPKRGTFITFEGIDGSGKTTQLEILGGTLRARGREVVITAEPGGTAIGCQIRRIVLDSRNAGLLPRTELLLYFASRAQNVHEVIEPALAAGAIVLCDRFTDSTLAYQGAGRGIDPAAIHALDRIACGGLEPDVTLLIDIDPATSLHRSRRRAECPGADESRMEKEPDDFHRRVHEGYRALAARHPDRVSVVDGSGAIEQVAALVWKEIAPRV